MSAMTVRVSADGGSIELAAGESGTVGRASTSDLVIDDPRVSRSHLRVEVAGRRCTVVDLGSRRGSYLGDERIERQTLEGTARLRLADPADGAEVVIEVEAGRRRPRLPIAIGAVAIVTLVAWAIVEFTRCGCAPPPLEDRLVSVDVSDPDGPVVTGGGVVIDGDRGLVVAEAGPDEQTAASYDVLVQAESTLLLVRALEIARTDDVVLLQLVGIEGSPALADHLRSLGSWDVAGGVPAPCSRSGSLDFDVVAAGDVAGVVDELRQQPARATAGPSPRLAFGPPPEPGALRRCSAA